MSAEVPVAQVQGTAPAPIPELTPQEQLQKNVADFDFAADDDTVLETPSSGVVGGKPAQTPLVSAPAPQKHSARTLRLAEHFGFSKEEIDSTSSADLLQEIQAAQVEAHEQTRISGLQAAVQGREQPTASAAAATPEPVLDFGGKTMKDAEGKDVGLSENDLHPGIVHVLKTLQKKVSALEADLAQERQGKQVQSAKQKFDGHFAKHSHLFGDTGHDALDPNGAEMARRLAVSGFMKSIDPKARTTFEADFDRAVKTIFGASSASPAPSPVPVEPAVEPRKTPPRDQETGRFTREEWESGGLGKPSNRAGSPETPGLAAAKKEFERGMRDIRESQTANSADDATAFD